MKLKWLRTTLAAAVAAVLCFGAAACGGDEKIPGGETENYVDPNTEFTHFDNKDYNEYLVGEETTISDQWLGYGIGDPFVMRYNGIYYLYVSTLDSETGVRAYKSADLVNWAPCQGEGLRKSYVSEDPVTRAAYAPEVYYINGTFYMYTSPGGSGHYVLTSDHPEGPFVKATNHLGLSIDGSVLIDDDETMYFTYASNGGIVMSKMASPTELAPGILLNQTSIGGWTEGSYILKRDGTYYLTYTGNHVASDGYRISYATSDKLTNTAGNINRQSFQAGVNNPIALSTESALKGLGHSSTVMGPDMDSYYLAYHMLNSSGGPNRSLGIDRLLFNGKQMTVAPTLTGSVTPKLPAFYATGLDADKFDIADATALSKTAATADFSAEFNVQGTDATKFVFSYTDDQNYNYVKLDYTAKTVKLTQVKDGTESEIASGTLVNTYAAADLHTVRVASRDGKVDVVFDNMTKIDNAQLETASGKIGYIGTTDAIVGYTAYSFVAMGLSDQREAKQSDVYIGASNYLDHDRYTKGSALSKDSAITVIDDQSALDGVKKLTLGAGNDFASYLVNFKESGYYGLEMIYPTEDGGKKIGIKLDDGKVMMVKLPVVETEEMYIKAIVTEFTVDKGIHTVRIESLDSKAVSMIGFTFTETSNQTPQYTAALDDYAAVGADYKTIWKLKDGGHYAKAGTRQLVYFGDNTITDFTMEVDVKFDGATGVSTAGLVFHAKNYASSNYDSYQSIQGYYLAINNNQMMLDRMNFADNTRNLSVYADNDNYPFRGNNEFLRVKVQVRGNVIKVWVADKEVLTHADDMAFTSGKIGLYTNGAAVIFKNLTISK